MPSEDETLRRGKPPDEALLATPATVIRPEPSVDPTGPTLIRGAREGAPAATPRRLGPYELIEVLGQGGMGVVWRARHAALGTECAVKVLVAGEHASLEAIVRFQREAAAVARMGKHPNVVSVFDLAQEGPVAYYAMELVRGRPLRAVLEAGSLDPREAARLVEKVARALHFAHEHGVVHRDMKPENVVVREDGEPQVMDFGLARDLRSDTRLSVAGEVFGTPAYMAPEQARGLHDQCDARTDVYALGGVLYDALTGLPPHPGKDLAQVFRHALEGEVVPPRSLRKDVPRDLENVCLKCLEADRAARYASAGALADDLARFLRGKPVSARPLGWLGRLARRVRRRPVSAALVALLALTLLALSWRLVGPARIRFSVDPSDANVEAVGRAMWGSGWVWPAGQFKLRVSAPGRQMREVPLDVSPGSTEDLGDLRLALLPAELSLAAWPPDAAVELVREEGGDPRRLSAPFDRLPIEPGTYHLTATREGWFPLERRVEMPPGAVLAEYLTLRRKTLWTRDLSDIIDRAPALADLDRDGALDVIACARTSCTVWALSGRDGSALWRTRVGEPLMCTPSIEDRNRDGVPDVRVFSFDRHAFALDGRDGALLPEAGDGPENGPPPPDAVDIDGDGFLDAVSLEPGRVVVSSLHGVGVASVTRQAGPVAPAPTVADLDGDGANDELRASGSWLVEATSGRAREKMWSSFFREEVSFDPLVEGGNARCIATGDLDGDGRIECVVACDTGSVYSLEGRTGARRWTWRIDGQPQYPIGVQSAAGRKGLDVVIARADGRVFVLRPPEAPDDDPFQRMLAHRAGAENWMVLEHLADAVAKGVEDPWRKAVGWNLLGIARERLGKHEEALAAFEQARSLGLRCPEAAAGEWTAAWAWKGCSASRREEAGRTLEEGLRTDPDRAFDAILEGSGAIDEAAARDLADRVRGVLDDPRERIVATLLATLLLPDDTRPPAPAQVDRFLREAVLAVQVRLSEAPSQAPRLFGYLCLLYDAQGDEERYRATLEHYLAQAGRPTAVDDLLMMHVNQRYGLR